MQLRDHFKSVLLFFTFFIFLFSFGQEKTLYLKFEENSRDFYLKEGESGKKVKEKTYWKSKQNNGDIRFFIKGLAFLYDESKMQEKIIDYKAIKSGNLLSADEVEKHIKSIQEKYPLGYKYPSKEHPIMFITERNEDSTFTLYEVKWEYYIE